MAYLDCVFISIPLVVWLLFWTEYDIGCLSDEDFEFAFFAILLAPLFLLGFTIILVFLFMLFVAEWISR